MQRRYTQEQREEILAHFRESGLSQTKFCQGKGLSRKTLSHWLEDEQMRALAAQGMLEVERDGDWGGAEQRLRVVLDNGLQVELCEPVSRAAAINWIKELASC